MSNSKKSSGAVASSDPAASHTFTRRRSPDPVPSRRPWKRRRTWADEVDRMALANGIETDQHRIAQRQKQIDFGKNTLAYDKYSSAMPREKRVRGDPMTPLARQKCSKRCFVGQLTAWKKKVYQWVDEHEAATKEDSKPIENEVAKCTTNGAKSDNPSTAAIAKNNEEPDVPCDDEDLNDLDDIQLDDFGNVIEPSTTKPMLKEQEETTEKPDRNESPPSIFDTY